MEKSPELRMVFVSISSYDSAVHTAKILVNEKLAACCTVNQNLMSIFGWQGHTQERHENIMMIKTTEAKIAVLEARIKELHNDEVPEIVALPVDSASASYLEWVLQSLAD